MPVFDTTIHASDLVLFGGGILAFLRIWLTMRDSVRDNSRDILRIDVVVKEHGAVIQKHESMLARLGFNRFAGE